MLTEFLILLFIILSIFIPGVIILSVFPNDNPSINSFNLWRAPWLGICYLIVFGINLNIAKIGLYKGGYGLDWFKGIYVLIFLLLIMVFWSVINSENLTKLYRHIIFNKLKYFIFWLLFCCAFLLTINLNLNFVDHSIMFDLSKNLVLNSKEVLIPQQKNINLGFSLLYSLFSNELANFQILDIIFTLVGCLLLLIVVIRYIVTFNDQLLKLLLLIVMVISWFLLNQMDPNFHISLIDILAWGITIQIMIIFFDLDKIFHKVHSYSLPKFMNENILIGLSFSALFWLNVSLAQTLIFYCLIWSIYLSVKKKNSDVVNHLLLSLVISYFLSPLSIGLNLFGS